VDSSWTANHFALVDISSTGSPLAGSTLIADGAPISGSVPVSVASTGGCMSVGQLARARSTGTGSRSARPDLYPEGLLSIPVPSSSLQLPTDGGERDLSQEGWWLAHTLPRQEKALASALYARDVPYYLPLVTRKSLSRGQTRVAQIALFPGYLFICGNEEDRLNVLKTNRVLTVRRAPDGERLRADLRRFHELISAGAPLLPEARLIAGERVRVKAGPFRDQEGVVIRRNGKTRLLIAVDYLQQGASLEVDDCLLERV
jgi:transcription antitermination factor NusG